jgi:hypothetical protein
MLQHLKDVRFWVVNIMSGVPGKFVLECIGYPVGDEARDTPLSRMARDGVKIFVRPAQHQYLNTCETTDV